MNYDKDTLNQEVLFHSRKMFGMFGNIQWHVTDIHNNTLYVQVSSPRTNIKRNQISKNIIASIHSRLPKMEVEMKWV